MRSRSACCVDDRGRAASRSAGRSTLAIRPWSSAHISSTGRGDVGMQSSSRKPRVGVLRNDAPDLVEDQLEPLVEEVASGLDGDELAGVELRVGASTSWNTLASISPETSCRTRSGTAPPFAAGAPFLARAQEEAGAGGASRRAQRSWAGVMRESRRSRGSATGRRPRSALHR